MNPILKKLGLKEQNPILILNAPEEYNEVIDCIEAEVHTEIRGTYDFIQVFAKDMEEAHILAEKAVKALGEDGHLWFCYPKGTSKKYKSDIKRNTTWDIFAPFEFEAVSQVSINDDWSAMCFRHVDKIKTMKRKTASTEKGKERIKKMKVLMNNFQQSLKSIHRFV
ncbi:DUF3052 domain-containing protein [Fonticella tunisiensis]|uniref:DUF3052 family protein n=1 Tax=Fonticella tunisiensis TaxID=1096341 RepID=A0A4R7KD72_9CLOT|nr:DUF3052 domain-containing protein [Fonticella tunisiensis]TDT51905.1 hypothetical protein EDD71_11741 [Fonticella tunisiensis]